MTNEEFQKLVLEKLTNAEKFQTNTEEFQSKAEEFQTKTEERLETIESEILKISASQQDDIKAMLKIIVDKTSDIKEEMQGITDILGEHSVDIAVLKRKTKTLKIAE